MHRSDFSDLNTFLAIADHLSFRGAAAHLGLTSSALSHSIRQLEERLGVRLLHRTTRSVSLTDSGIRLLERLRPGMEQISSALEELKDQQHRPSGRLRIYTHTDLILRIVIAPIWERFVSSHPEVRLELCVEPAPIDLASTGFDAGVAQRSRIPAEAIAIRASHPIQIAVVGSRGYLAKRPVPRRPDDVASHRCVAFRFSRDGELHRWVFERKGRKRIVSPPAVVTVNSPDAALQAAVDGIGLAYLTEDLVRPFLKAGKLVQVLKEWSPSIEGYHLYYQSRRQPSAALRALIDMVRAPKASSDHTSVKNPF
ncbi:LysR family transcriptional regulator [Bradyrhizobium sp. AZCC 2289]|uniref:LysR family transcriptional regulator n=1 Tax=Bradyrhizobium sp. AZCC 2289 TaxID=3117026 RepID=UPI002FF3AED8